MLGYAEWGLIWGDLCFWTRRRKFVVVIFGCGQCRIRLCVLIYFLGDSELI